LGLSMESMVVRRLKKLYEFFPFRVYNEFMLIIIM